MTPIDDPAIAALCSELVAMRGRGTRCEVCARVSENARVDADAIARWCDFKALGDRWREIDRDAAKAILGNVLARDLAYGSTLNTDTLAALDTDRFLSVVGDAVYFTNGELGCGHGSAG